MAGSRASNLKQTREKRQRAVASASAAAAVRWESIDAALCEQRATAVTRSLIWAYLILAVVLVVFPALYTHAEDSGLLSSAPRLFAMAATAITLVNMLLVSTSVVFIGARVSAARDRLRRWALEQSRTRAGADDSESVAAALAALEREVIGRGDALRFPLVASLGLIALFMAIRYLPQNVVQLLIGMYVALASLVSMTSILSPLLDLLEHRLRRSPRTKPLGMLMARRFGLFRDTLSVHGRDVLGMVLALPLLYWYRQSSGLGAAILNNIFAASLGVAGIDLLAIGDFQTAVVLLVGLFLYDIFWVFGSEAVFGDNVMVSVARGIDGPFKFVFYRLRARPDAARDMSMLGLGDLVIPGLFVALMLRFDHRHLAKPSLAPKHPYFSATYMAYALGMVTTFVAMAVSKAAQPALLYLVPFCLVAPLMRAWRLGELRSLWYYREHDAELDSHREPHQSSCNDT
jgi:minor histocompatibility antigen H13